MSVCLPSSSVSFKAFKSLGDRACPLPVLGQEKSGACRSDGATSTHELNFSTLPAKEGV